MMLYSKLVLERLLIFIIFYVLYSIRILIFDVVDFLHNI
jgi:hypothetical protein